MCCLFGVMDYGKGLSKSKMNRILNVLATACEARGTDAAGIAYNYDGRLRIYKRPFPAHKLHIHVPEGVNVVMGHTRMTTQGSEKQNYNNHPFFGKADIPFALAHNGVIYNDDVIRNDENLPDTHIKTDSYIAVQMIEKKGELTFDNLKYMAEQLEGSFTITVMDYRNTLYIVKGDNPMCIYHYPKSGVYIYTSTEEILQSALKKLHLRLGEPIKIPIVCGEILRIDQNGKRTTGNFCADKLYFDYGYYPYSFRYTPLGKSEPSVVSNPAKVSYLNELKSFAHGFGYSDDYIDYLLEEGYDLDDIEEMLYCG